MRNPEIIPDPQTKCIVKMKGRCGGRATVEGRRIPVRSIMGLLQIGSSPGAICEEYDLTYEQVAHALAYYILHRKEIEDEEVRLERVLSQISGERVGT